MDEVEVPGWTGTIRTADGMRVRKGLGGNWMVLPSDGRPILSFCPTCGTQFSDAEHAKISADGVYPPSSFVRVYPPAE